MDAFTLQMLENEITILEKQEDELRNQADDICLKRQGLEDFLIKIKQTDTVNYPENVIDAEAERPPIIRKSSPGLIPTKRMTLQRRSKKAKNKAKRVIRFSKPQITDAIMHILSDGMKWKMVDIRTGLNNRFHDEVPNSSLRDAIKTLEESNQIRRADYGVYMLAAINTSENPVAAQS